MSPWRYDAIGRPVFERRPFPCVFCSDTGLSPAPFHEATIGDEPCGCPGCRCPVGCPRPYSPSGTASTGRP